MPKMKTTGLNETLKMLESIEGNTDEILEDVLREGAMVTTDEMREQIGNLRTSDEYEGGDGKRYAKKSDVKGLFDSLGFAPVRFNDTVVDSHVGFDGYNNDKTKKYPKGHANQMIANAINKGTSFMIAQPFINRTKKAAEAKCNEMMQKKLDEEIQRLTK
jgi:hypothetical protein